AEKVAPLTSSTLNESQKSESVRSFPVLHYTRTSLAYGGVVVEPLVDDLAVLPSCNCHLFPVHRLPIRRNEVFCALVEGHVIAQTECCHVKPFPLLDAVHELLFSLDVGGLTDGRRIAIFLHRRIVVIELLDRLNDLALTNVAEQIVQSLP